MARKQAGRGYPHISSTARPHNHRMCPVIAEIARAAYAGHEPWGTRHEWTVRTEQLAKDAKTGFYAAKRCGQLKNEFGEYISVQTDIEPHGDAWKVWVKTWPRSVAKAEIARRVEAGEPLAYNVLRGTA